MILLKRVQWVCRRSLVIVAAIAVSTSVSAAPPSEIEDAVESEDISVAHFETAETDDEDSADDQERRATDAKYREVERIFEQVNFEQRAEVGGNSSDSDGVSSSRSSSNNENSGSASKPSGESVPLEDSSKGSPRNVRHRWEDASMDWTFRSGANGLGIFSMKSMSTRDLDFNDPSNLDIEFEYSLHFTSGPLNSDLPARLYDLYFNVHWLQQLGDGVGVDANFDLGLFTDFEDSVREGWRYPGRALAFWNLDGEEQEDTVTLLAGIEFFDTDAARVIPAGGIIIQPDEDHRLELYFPRPQIKWRVSEDEDSDCWFYVRGDFQSTAWAIERSAGNADVASLSEKRVAIGFETRSLLKDGETSFVELGYVFDRELRYRSGLGNIDPNSSMMFRFGSRF